LTTYYDSTKGENVVFGWCINTQMVWVWVSDMAPLLIIFRKMSGEMPTNCPPRL